jgi:hypothetical protein
MLRSKYTQVPRVAMELFPDLLNPEWPRAAAAVERGNSAVPQLNRQVRCEQSWLLWEVE